jgi:hypothetical protein
VATAAADCLNVKSARMVTLNGGAHPIDFYDIKIAADYLIGKCPSNSRERTDQRGVSCTVSPQL